MGSYRRLEAKDKIESAWTAHISAQSTTKELRKWLKPWKKIAEPEDVNKNDLDAFCSAFGKGF